MKWLLAGLTLIGIAQAQNLEVIGPATTLQELFYNAPFPRPTYKLEPKGCYEFLASELGLPTDEWQGDEVKTGDEVQRLACYASDMPASEVPSYVFDFTQTLQGDDITSYEILTESTEQNTTSQYWWSPTSDYSFWIRYYTYEKGLLIFASIEQPAGDTE